MIRSTVLISAALFVPVLQAKLATPVINAPFVQPIDQPAEEDWDLVMASLPDDTSQTKHIARRLAGADPDVGWPVVERHWTTIRPPFVRRQIIGAFSSASHRNMFDLLAIGVVDEDEDVSKTAKYYLEEIAFSDFDGHEQQMRQWCKARSGQDVKAVQAAALAKLLFEIKSAQGDELIKKADFLSRRMRTATQDHLQTTLRQAGLRELATQWITDTEPIRELVSSATSVLRSIDPGEDYARQIILPLIQPGNESEVRTAAVGLLGHWTYPWAVEPLVQLLQAEAKAPAPRRQLWTVAMALAEIGDRSVIPAMIEIIEGDNTYDTVYGVGYFGLSKLTGVRYDESHDGAWWRAWWEQEQEEQPVVAEAPTEQKRDPFVDADDVADIPTQDLNAAGDKRMRYALIGPMTDESPPADGYKLLLIMPGGSGSPAFHAFVKRIYKHAAPPGYIAIQPVAYQWNEKQAKEIVWPTSRIKDKTVEFTTEQFIDAVIKDVADRMPINKDYIFTLSWSSSGPAAYAAALRQETPVTGSIVAMSVFKPQTLPPLENASGKPFYIIHSPDDKVCPFPMAESARDTLKEKGASVHLMQYAGGHGWRGPVYKWIGDAIKWLETEVTK